MCTKLSKTNRNGLLILTPLPLPVANLQVAEGIDATLHLLGETGDGKVEQSGQQSGVSGSTNHTQQSQQLPPVPQNQRLKQARRLPNEAIQPTLQRSQNVRVAQ